MLLCSTLVVFLVFHSNKSTEIISTFMEEPSVKEVLYWWSWQILQQIICLEVIRNLLVALKESVPIIWQTCNEELHDYHLRKMQENPSLHQHYSKYGVVARIVLMDAPHCHVIQQMPLDITHVILEGALSRALYFVLKRFLDISLFTIHGSQSLCATL